MHQRATAEPSIRTERSNTTLPLCNTTGEHLLNYTQGASRLRLVYFVHDLGDPAVSRRLSMLRPFLASALVIGFHRAAAAPPQVAGWPTISLGRTADGRLGRRALSVLNMHAMIWRLRPHLLGATVIMARQLEMLALAGTARRRYAETALLAYEFLDIHRLMVARSVVGATLRRLEARLLRATDLLVVSSPAFVREYLQPTHGAKLPPTCLIENKVLRDEHLPSSIAKPRPAGPPWRIGWFGVLRCRKSLELLTGLARQLPGQVIVDLRGRPARSAIPDFDALVSATPGVTFLGPYDRHHELAEIYQAVHFTWAIDFYEAGANSKWLLPNRLYEGGLHGAIPIALASVETGSWLARHDTGVLLHEPLAEELLRYFSALQTTAYAASAKRLATVTRETWVDDGHDGARLASALLRRRAGIPASKSQEQLVTS
ncbi:MAG: succinoglycan biosynthesis protein [Rhodospirillales bacterium]|nr:succinoglycan biosynthesis protein [Rhodospirillales bacterium]